MLRTKDLQFAYGGGRPISFPDIDCKSREQWLLLGQSGSGKTTLLHLLAGLRTPTRGEVWVDDKSLGTMAAAQLDSFRGKHIGIIFQQSHFLRALSVKENLAIAQSLAGASPDTDQINGLLTRLNIGHKLNESTGDLSVGEQQRVAIARALINKPSIILADEPTSALDDKNAGEVINLIREQADQVGATLMIVTHDRRLKKVFNQQVILDPIGTTA